MSPEHFRSTARLGIQAAEALQHAHDLGVLHRDIKPSNLMVECSHLAPRDEPATGATRVAKPHHVEDRPWRSERDGYTPKLWITDFGLARIGADAGLTMTGDTIGAFRYMAPEQALAKRIVIEVSLGISPRGHGEHGERRTRRQGDGETRRSSWRPFLLVSVSPCL